MILWQRRWTGKLPAVNDWHGARSIGGHARIFETTKYKRLKADLLVCFLTPGWVPIDVHVDLIVEVTMWRVRDTDGPIKAIQDTLEKARIVKKDILFRDLMVPRGYHKRDEPDGLRIAIVSTDEDLLRRMLRERNGQSAGESRADGQLPF